MTSSSLQVLPLYLFATCTDKHMDKKNPNTVGVGLKRDYQWSTQSFSQGRYQPQTNSPHTFSFAAAGSSPCFI